MKIIFAVDKNWSIGLKGDMLFHISTDLKRFKEITMGNILLMGRKTLDSLPNSKPLPGRTNIVVTRNKAYKNDPAIVVHSLDEAYDLIDNLNKDNDHDVFCIGGGNLVRQVFDKCDYAYITKMDKAYENWDTNIPNLDELDDWEIESESETMEFGEMKYKYVNYRKIK